MSQNSSYQPIILHLDDDDDVIRVSVETIIRPVTVHLGTFTGWDSIGDKPDEFPPAQHQHLMADTTGLAEALAGKPDDAPNDGKQYARIDGSWAEVDGLPDQDGHQGKALVTDGTTATWQQQTGGGDVEEAPQDGQLYFRHNGAWTAVSDTFLESTPVGLTALWDGSVTAPAGWLECDGAQIVKDDYPELFALYKDKVEAGKAFLPDYRGEFIRGWDNGRGVDADRELGSEQSDDIAEHAHAVAIAINESRWDQMPFGTSPDLPVARGEYHDLGSGDTAEGNEQWMMSSPTGGSENRPRNRSAMVIIKAIAGPNLVSQIAVPQRSVYSAIAGQQTFNHTYEINRPVSVFVSGLKLIKGMDFTADNGTSISLNNPLAADASVEIESLGKLVLSAQTDVSDLTDQVNDLTSNLSQVQSQVSTQGNDVTQLQTDAATASADIGQLQTDVATASSGLSQAQADIGDQDARLTQLEASQTTSGNDISQLQSSTSTLTDALAALTLRVAALESTTPTEPPADEDDDMKLLESINVTDQQEIVLETGFEAGVYAGYYLVIGTLGQANFEDYGEKTFRMSFKQADGQWVNGYGSADTSLLRNGHYLAEIEGSQSGHTLTDGEMSDIYYSGTLSVNMTPAGKGSWTANLNTGNDGHYISAYLSAPIYSEIFGIKFTCDNMVGAKMLATLSLYGLKK